MKDLEIRKLMKISVLKRFREDGKSKIVPELSILKGKNRVDIAVVNGHLHAFEIKSDFDTLSRLNDQIESYLKVFDYVSVVAGSKHLEETSKNLPPHVGLFEVKNEGKIVRKRSPKKNRQTISIALCQLLWKEELINLLDSKVSTGLSSKNRNELNELVASNFSKKEISDYVRITLKSRKDWRADELPIQNGDYLQPVSKSSHSQVLRF